MGFKTFKWDPFVEVGAPPTSTLEKEVEQVRAIHDAVGPEMRIAIDAHDATPVSNRRSPPPGCWSPSIRCLRGADPARSPGAAAQSGRRTSIPLAVGETHRTVAEAKEWLDTEC